MARDARAREPSQTTCTRRTGKLRGSGESISIGWSDRTNESNLTMIVMDQDRIAHAIHDSETRSTERLAHFPNAIKKAVGRTIGSIERGQRHIVGKTKVATHLSKAKARHGARRQATKARILIAGIQDRYGLCPAPKTPGRMPSSFS